MKYLSLRMEPNYLNALANQFAVFHKLFILFISWMVHIILVRIWQLTHIGSGLVLR